MLKTRTKTKICNIFYYLVDRVHCNVQLYVYYLSRKDKKRKEKETDMLNTPIPFKRKHDIIHITCNA